MTTRYKLIDAEGYTDNIIILEDNSNYVIPENMTLEEDDGIYNFRNVSTKEILLDKILSTEAKVTTRRLLEASLGNQASINFLAQINSELEALRQQLKTAK